MKGEIGSSTMPHKVNPIDFENAEGNLGVANVLLSHFAEKLLISRMQRDLTDSTVLRCLGVAFGHCLIAYEATLRGLGKVAVDEVAMKGELEKSWMLLAEPVQTVIRKAGIENPYEKLKEFTRGHEVGKADMQKFIGSLELNNEGDQKRLAELTPTTYTGMAAQLAREVKLPAPIFDPPRR